MTFVTDRFIIYIKYIKKHNIHVKFILWLKIAPQKLPARAWTGTANVVAFCGDEHSRLKKGCLNQILFFSFYHSIPKSNMRLPKPPIFWHFQCSVWCLPDVYLVANHLVMHQKSTKHCTVSHCELVDRRCLVLDTSAQLSINQFL